MNYKILFEQYLSQSLNNNSLSESIKYSLLNGGNRFRPLLVLTWCNIAGGKVEDALPLAAALECIHTMSLIQDDLPCMDNALERRNQPCLHLINGEANAILTSDALFSLGFDFIVNSHLSNEQKIMSLNILNQAIFATINGQNIEFTDTIVTQSQYLNLHKQKTGALLTAACQLGVIAADPKNTTLLQIAEEFGLSLGIGYQIQDDIKDNDGIVNITNNVQNLLNIYINQCQQISVLYPQLQPLLERIFIK